MCEKCEDPLFGLKATNDRAERLSNNCKYLIDKFDEMHYHLFESKKPGTWQDHVVEYVLNLKK
jgi:hypothetical protein